ncbi:hypothetical protein HN935_01810 [archaeon]|nr:hypothetical protein [archaeon]
MIGATVGAAAAASYPAPFTSNTAIVVGANAAPSDTINGANLIADDLDSASTTGATLTGAVGETEDEVPLGGILRTGKLASTLTDSKIASLLDTKVNWDDGGPSGADDYNVHEEILLGGMAINTTFHDNDFAELLALTNDKQLEYRYVFDDAFNVTGVGATGTNAADTLYLTILGQQYEISAMTTTSITVVTSEEVSLGIGESVTVDGKTFTVDDVFDGKAQINGEIITESSSKKINGIQVEVDTVGYHSNAPELSKVIIKVGDDISKTYSAGEEYIGENSDNPTWVWTFSDPSTANGYIGVKYNQKETRDTDDVVFEGGSFMLPENFGEVRFDGTTDVTYEDFKVYFDDSEELWDGYTVASSGDANVTDAKVLIIESVDGTKDSIRLTGTNETSLMMIRMASATTDILSDTTNSSLEVYFKDVNKDVEEAIRTRHSQSYETSDGFNLNASDLGDLVVGDTTIAMSAAISAGNLQITFTDGGAAQAFTVDVGGVNITNTTGDLKWFGGDVEGTDKEDGLAGDMLVASTNVGTYDYDIMTTNGQIIRTPESNLDNDEVVFSVPSDRVYAIVSVVAGGDAVAEAGVMTVKDTEVASVSGKNLIVVGGSAINNVAAELLDGAFSEGAFTTATGVGAGEFLIQSFDRSGKTALLVAGYNPEDTEKAVTALLNSDVDTTVGMKYVSQSTTVSSTDLVTA